MREFTVDGPSIAWSTAPSFGCWLRQSRKAGDLTQAELARALFCATITIRKYEADVQPPTREIARAIAAFFAVPTDQVDAFVLFARGKPVPGAAPDDRARRPRTNLPIAPTSLIGRADDVARARSLLERDDVRLLTLVGPPGVGKTRLALQIATELQETFADGAFLVELASVHDPQLVVLSIGHALRVPEDGQQDLLGHLKEVLSLRRTLLVLDNFEHVLSAGSDVGALLQETAGLKVLVTSREVLRLSGEHVFEVPALAIPGPRDRWSPATLGEYSAVDLFVRRLAASRPTFAVTPRNAASIAEICQRLDGLPLAIELAAARGKHLPLRTLLARLDDRFSSLRAGPRDYPRRHQTLRSALEWSYELLDPAERRLFARLGVFVGGTIEAISAVCAEGQEGMEEVEGRLESLVDKSLVQREWGTDDEARFTMLGTLREYAVGWLAQGGELDTYRRRHLAYYRSLAEQAAPELTGAQQGAWLARLEREHDNLRAALRWALTREDGEGAARLGAALWRFWWAHGHLTEGRRWMEETLALLEGVEAADDLRARVLTGVGVLARVHGDVARARTALDQALVIWKQLGTTREIALVLTNLGLLGEVEGDQRAEDYLRQSLAAWREVADARGTAHALHNLAWLAIVRGAYDQARPLLGESLALFRNLHDDWSCALVLRNLAWVAIEEGKTDHAVELLEEALARSRDLGDDAGCANSLSHLGLAYYRRGDLERAVQLLEESLATCRILGERRALANVMHNLGVVVQERGDVVRATDYLVESLRIFHSLGDLRGVAECLEALSGAVASRGRATDAAQLLRAAGGLRERTGAPIARTFRAAYERAVRVVEARAGQATTESAPTDGPPASLDRIADEVAEFLAISPGSGETDVSAVGPTIAERPGSAATATSGTVRSSQPAKSGPGVTLHASWRKRAS